MLKQNIELKKEKEAVNNSAIEKDKLLKKKLGTIGNIVHDSVPVHNDEVSRQNSVLHFYTFQLIK